MIRMRPIREGDLDGLERLAHAASVGLTSLPKDRDRLERKIADSLASFAKAVAEPGDESYLFVMEETEGPRVVGTSAIYATVGKGKPFYSYKLGTLVQTSEEHKIYKELQLLYLVNDYTGITEIGTLFLDPEFRRDGNGQLLSRSRFLFIARFRERFHRRLLAEMRGMFDAEGKSPFWNNLGRKFFDMEFTTADYLTGSGNKRFINDLMPKYPIYTALLPDEAREVIGRVHPATEPALEMLRREGLEATAYVDIFDAGPTVEAPVRAIHSVRESRAETVAAIVDRLDEPSAADSMLSNDALDYRACRGRAAPRPGGGVAIEAAAAAALEVGVGAAVRLAPFKLPPAHA